MLSIRDQLKNLYAEYDFLIRPAVKYMLALFTFISINRSMGYLDILNHAALILLLSIACAILPWNAIPVFGTGMVILHCFGLGREVGACALVLYMLLLIFYFRFVPDDGLALTLTLAACSVGLPGIVPMGLGLKRSPASALTAVCSMISWFFIRTVREAAVPLKQTPDHSMLEVVNAILDAMVKNRLLIVYSVTFAAVVLVVSLIRSSGLSWSWETAIAAGAVLQLVLYLVLGGMLSAELDIPAFAAGTAAAAVISCILTFFVYRVDYRGAERLQFEDDEFVYYVKAIPKKKEETDRAQEEN